MLKTLAPIFMKSILESGITLSVEDGRIVARPARFLTDAQRTIIREHKQGIIVLLTTGMADAETDSQLAPLPLFDNPLHAELHTAGYLVWNSGEAEAQLSRFVSLLLLEQNGTWRLLRCRWKPDEQMAAEERQIAETRDYSAAVKRACSYLQWTRRKRVSAHD